VHPNDHVKTVHKAPTTPSPTAMHISAARQTHAALLPAGFVTANELDKAAQQHAAVYQIGRTHMMDATP